MKLILIVFFLFLYCFNVYSYTLQTRKSIDIQELGDNEKIVCDGPLIDYEIKNKSSHYKCEYFILWVQSMGLTTFHDKWTVKGDGHIVNKIEKGTQFPRFCIKTIIHTFARKEDSGYQVLLNQEVEMYSGHLIIHNTNEHVAFFQTKGVLTNLFYLHGTVMETNPQTNISNHEKKVSKTKRKHFKRGNEKSQNESESETTDWKIAHDKDNNASKWTVYLTNPFDAENDTPKNFGSWIDEACLFKRSGLVTKQYILKDIPLSARNSYKFNTQTLFQSNDFFDGILHISFDHILGDVVIGSPYRSHNRYTEKNYFYYKDYIISSPK